VPILNAGSLWFLLASATPQQPSDATAQQSAACPPEPGERLHDGFFARSAPGLAFFTSLVDDRGPGPRRSGVRGIGQSATILTGGTPLAGLVVGGLVFTARIDPVFIEDGRTVSPDDDSVKLTLLHLGPFVDWYPDARRGFHVQASASFAAQVESDTKGNPLEPAAVGGAFALGAGYEWYLGGEFSLGGAARVAFGGLRRNASDGVETSLFLIPELALTATYH
jgi:hypothetical protein